MGHTKLSRPERRLREGGSRGTGFDPIKGLEAGADNFLTRPVNLAELLARVRSLLGIKTPNRSRAIDARSPSVPSTCVASLPSPTTARIEPAGELMLKGFHRAMPTFRLRLR